MDRLLRNRFAVLGRVGMDLYADPPGTRIEEARAFTTALGGSAGNIAVALARQGAQAALIARVSDDAVGRYCVAQLQGYGVTTDAVRTEGGEARNSLAVVETRTAPQVVLYRNNAADFALNRADVEAADFSGTGALIVTGTALAAEPSRGATFLALEKARAQGALTVLDIDHRAYSWPSDQTARKICTEAALRCDIIIGNDDEFGLLAGSHADGPAYARQIARSHALFTCYKQGALGCITFTPHFEFETPIFRVRARKPMGAGDGFMGGLIAGLAQGHTLPNAVRRGAATAALIVAGIGCAPASPDTATLNAFLAEGTADAYRPL